MMNKSFRVLNKNSKQDKTSESNLLLPTKGSDTKGSCINGI